MRHKSLVVAAVAALLLAACGNDSSSPSATDAPDTTDASDTSDANGDATTTVAGSQDSVPASDARDADTLAQAKVQAALDSLPLDWMGTIASDLGEEGDSADDIVFNPCLTADDYNLDNLDADSLASWELDAEGPAGTSPFGGAAASLEARVFADAATTDAAYAVLAKILGTDAGRECLVSQVPGQLAEDAPEGSSFDARVEGTTIQGVDVGARVIIAFSSEGFTGEFYLDLVAKKSEPNCTIFATFISFGVPVDQAVASAMFIAADEA